MDSEGNPMNALGHRREVRDTPTAGYFSHSWYGQLRNRQAELNLFTAEFSTKQPKRCFSIGRQPGWDPICILFWLEWL